jgi:hypothetical protein
MQDFNIGRLEMGRSDTRVKRDKDDLRPAECHRQEQESQPTSDDSSQFEGDAYSK